MILVTELFKEVIEGAVSYVGVLGRAKFVIRKNPMKDLEDPASPDLLLYLGAEEDKGSRGDEF
jgi:hypothetical protein